MIGEAPICVYCLHLARPSLTCTAFPEGIPDEIIKNEFDHREPHPGDRGIQWEPDPERPMPAWADPMRAET
jgi:hypothetical protein